MARPGRDAREVARRVVRRVAADDAFASLTLAAELDAAGLDPRDRRLATELVYGVLRHLTRLDRALHAMTERGLAKVNRKVLAILRVAAYQILFLDRVPDHAAVDDAVRAARKLGGGRLAGFANGVLRRLTRDGEPPLPGRAYVASGASADAAARDADADAGADSDAALSDARAYIEVAHSLPPWLADRLRARLGEPAELLAAAEGLSQPAGLTIRVNTARTTVDALSERLRADHDTIEIIRPDLGRAALLLYGLGDPERSPSFRAGLWTVQDLGAQLVSHFIDYLGDRPAATGSSDGAAGLRILDACAGVGGKASHLAELYSGAHIDAVDISERKLRRLRDTADRLGATGIHCHTVDLTDRAAGDGILAATYDAVLVDAPCSGLGVLRRHPETKWRVSESDIARMAELQRQLLDALCQRVAPGGILIYSVCTFTAEEGARQLAAFLDRHSDFALSAPQDESFTDRQLCPEPGVLTTWPHRHQADAFFAARLVRRTG
ncbi:MAG: 16S rRNA (cytosine(967)-C(5))-methyltransferase RsmB [Myxococcota bacterium]